MNIYKRLSRRDFLKCAGIVAGSVALTACDGLSKIGTSTATPHATSIEVLSTRTPTNVPPTNTPRPEIHVNKNSKGLTEYAGAHIAAGAYDEQIQAFINLINGWVDQRKFVSERKIEISFICDQNNAVIPLIETQDSFYSAPLKNGDPDFNGVCCDPFKIPKIMDGLEFAFRGNQFVYLDSDGNVKKHINSLSNSWVDESTDYRMCATMVEGKNNVVVPGDREYMRFAQRNDKTLIDPQQVKYLTLLPSSHATENSSITFIATVGDSKVEWADINVRPTRRVTWGTEIIAEGRSVPVRIVKYGNPDGKMVYYWLVGTFRQGSPEASSNDLPVVARNWEGEAMIDPQISLLLYEYINSDDNGDPAYMPLELEGKVLWGD